MAQSILGSITLGYRPLWNRARALAGLQLFIHEDGQGVDGQHLLRTLSELWSAESPPLVLAPRSRDMLAGLLTHAGANEPMIEVPAAWLADAALAAKAKAARARGARLLLRRDGDKPIDPATAAGFVRRVTTLSADDAMAALHASMRAKDPAAARTAAPATPSPVAANDIVEGVASRALAEHALDQQGAWAVAGWPSEDAVHRYRGQPLPPTRGVILQAMRTLDAEPSLEQIEHVFTQEAVLTYRLLLYVNSAGLGLRGGIASMRHTFMMLGLRSLHTWLAEQLPHASEDANLRPVNGTMVMRGLLAETLMDAGIEDDLRREAYLCGLFADLDLVMDEPLRKSLARIPLSERIVSAIITRSGPYAPVLEVAMALELEEPDRLRALRAAYDMSAEDVNRGLLRTLAGVSGMLGR